MLNKGHTRLLPHSISHPIPLNAPPLYISRSPSHPPTLPYPLPLPILSVTPASPDSHYGFPQPAYGRGMDKRRRSISSEENWEDWKVAPPLAKGGGEGWKDDKEGGGGMSSRGKFWALRLCCVFVVLAVAIGLGIAFSRPNATATSAAGYAPTLGSGIASSSSVVSTTLLLRPTGIAATTTSAGSLGPGVVLAPSATGAKQTTARGQPARSDVLPASSSTLSSRPVIVVPPTALTTSLASIGKPAPAALTMAGPSAVASASSGRSSMLPRTVARRTLILR